jgi:hypothetical protein
MFALRAHQRGGALTYEEAPTPEPGAGEVLVAVHAAAITLAGSLRPVVAAAYPLAEGAAAFVSGNGPRRPGRIILIVRT